METELNAIINGVITRAPQWIRQDLLARDANVRERAEEALSAMIASAIAEADLAKPASA
jgi:hypothetical protein